MCDSCFNLQIPKSTSRAVVVRPNAATFVTGLAKSYATEYPHELKGYISEPEFASILEAINDTLYTYFPCNFCWFLGYGCSIFTLGLSLCCPMVCVADADKQLSDLLVNINKNRLKSKGIKLSLRKKCSTSWLQFDLPSDVVESEKQALL